MIRLSSDAISVSLADAYSAYCLENSIDPALNPPVGYRASHIGPDGMYLSLVDKNDASLGAYHVVNGVVTRIEE